MRLFRIFSLLSLAVMAVSAAIERGLDRAHRFVVDMFVELAPDLRPRIATDGPVMNITGTAIDGALMHSMRHEAGLHRRSAPRGC